MEGVSSKRKKRATHWGPRIAYPLLQGNKLKPGPQRFAQEISAVAERRIVSRDVGRTECRDMVFFSKRSACPPAQLHQGASLSDGLPVAAAARFCEPGGKDALAQHALPMAGGHKTLVSRLLHHVLPCFKEAPSRRKGRMLDSPCLLRVAAAAWEGG